MWVLCIVNVRSVLGPCVGVSRRLAHALLGLFAKVLEVGNSCGKGTACMLVDVVRDKKHL